MANITTCGTCGSCYEAGSEEQANEPSRTCPKCTIKYHPDCAACLRGQKHTLEEHQNCIRRAQGNDERVHFREEELGGVLGADGQVHSDADPGL